MAGSSGCEHCGNCCRVPGYVRLRRGEVERMADSLGIELYAFSAEFTRLTDGRGELSLVERSDGSCVFLAPGGSCRVYAARPGQCRDFPGRWRYDDMASLCAAGSNSGKGEI